jgi:hypothetical protein
MVPSPDVIIMDASLLGGLLFSEASRVPTVALASSSSLELAVEHATSWQPPTAWSLSRRIYRFFRQRFRSALFTVVFVRYNRIRDELGLPRVKSPVDILLPVERIISDISRLTDINLFGNHQQESTVLLHPTLIPPCVPCVDTESDSVTTFKNESIIMVVPPSNASASFTRIVLRGLVLARQSLQSFDDCSWDASCLKPNFQVLWVRPGHGNDFFPPVVPEFIYNETFYANILDNVARYPYTILALVDCDVDTNILTAFDLGVMCFSTSSRMLPLTAASGMHSLRANKQGRLVSSDIAAQILLALRRTTVGVEVPSSIAVSMPRLNGLQQVTQLVQNISNDQRTNKSQSGNDGSHRTKSRARRIVREDSGNCSDAELTSKEQYVHNAAAVFAAWCIIMSAALYLVLSAKYSRNDNNYKNEGLFFCISGHFSDLDDAWMPFSSWYHEQKRSLFSVGTDDDRSALPKQSISENRSQEVRRHHHLNGSMQRRRKTKTSTKDAACIAGILLTVRLNIVRGLDGQLCDPNYDPCPFERQFNGLCEETFLEQCSNGDCFDCDPCRNNQFDLRACIANGCFWCPGDGSCAGSDQYPSILGLDQSPCFDPSDYQSTTQRNPQNFFPDPLYDAQKWVYDMIRVVPVWEAGIFGTGVNVRINDLGIDASNLEFEGRFDFESSCESYEPTDGSYHGTAVAAIIGAAGNEKCSVGIAPQAVLSACNFVEDPGLIHPSTDISSNSFGIDGCGPLHSRRDQETASGGSDCPFQNSVVSPCNVCDFTSSELSSGCKRRIMSYCSENFKLDQNGCIEFLDIVIGGSCDFNFVPKQVQAELTR